MAVAWGKPEERYLTGHDAPRVDGAAKVTGKARYAYDINLPGLLYGKILRSPHPHATVKSVNLAKAKAHPGVKAALDFEKKTVRYAGEEVAAVAAVSPDVAEEALRLIEVEYERLPHVVDEDEAQKPEAPKIHQDGNVRPRKDDPQ
ncbi:xanthine dehydrogenase family protein molybdopterin-binding subunit, partial [bacterium]|nr:xanthine dehydrogenase family protein molybdopterin-binding subunit [bacterium]